MAIKMRRGADADFRPEKMQPGELAVTVDGTRKVYAAFAAGDVKELSSKEDVDKTIASGLQSLETSTNNKLQSLEKKASSAVDKISSENQRVQEELSRYEYYTKTESDLKYTVAPRKEASSANGELKLTDADYGLSYLELQGNSEQYTNTANKNLIDLHFATDGYYVNNVNGALAVNPNYKASGYINVIPGESYFLTNASQASPGAMYNANKVYVQGVVNGLNVIPEGVKYVRISATIAGSTQFEKGTQGTEIVIGAVDTPSPDYPSEVRSVGDIPKDVNGVEIRNLLDEEWIKSQPESAWTKDSSGTVFSIEVALPKTRLYIRTPDFNATDAEGTTFGISKRPGSLAAVDGIYFYKTTLGSFDFSGQEHIYIILVRQDKNWDLAKKSLMKSRLMVTSATEIDEYRPYIGENNGLVKIESTGKNLFNIDQEFKKYDSTMTYVIQDNKIRIKGKWYISCAINVDKNTEYQLSLNANKSADTGQRVAVYDEEIKVQLGAVLAAPSSKMLFNSGDNHILSILLYSGNGSIGEIEYSNIQIEKGTIPTEFQPYHQQITWIPLKEPLRSLPDGRADIIDRDGNVIQYVGCSGVEQYPIAQETDQMFEGNLFRTSFKSGNYVGVAKKDNGVYCNIMKFKQTTSLQYGVSASPLYGIIYFNLKGKLSESTVDLARKFLNDNNAVFYFTLGTPITYQIPAVYIETYDKETNVRCLNKVKPSSMGLDYKIAISSLIKRLEALESAAVNNGGK